MHIWIYVQFGTKLTRKKMTLTLVTCPSEKDTSLYHRVDVCQNNNVEISFAF